MRRKSRLRTFTSLVIIGACAYTMAGALTILRYSVSDSADTAEGAKRLAGYADVFPVSYLARRTLAQRASRGQPAQMIEPFVSLLSVTPADGAAWLTLAEAKAFVGKPADQVVKALAMSSLTAPSESRVMKARALFTLQMWNFVPPEAQGVFVNDVFWTFSINEFSQEQIANLRAGLAALPEDARRRIITQLQATGKRGEKVLLELKLQASVAPP